MTKYFYLPLYCLLQTCTFNCIFYLASFSIPTSRSVTSRHPISQAPITFQIRIFKYGVHKARDIYIRFPCYLSFLDQSVLWSVLLLLPSNLLLFRF